MASSFLVRSHRVPAALVGLGLADRLVDRPQAEGTLFVVAGLAAAAAVPAAYWARRPRDVMAVVDCGSGGTRATTFGRRGDVVVVVDSRRVEGRVVVADALADETAADDFASAVAAAAARRVPVYVGATGGARVVFAGKQLLAAGSSDSSDSSCLLRASLVKAVPTATFEVVSAEDEARYELLAARYDLGDASIGVLSGGGSSVQLANDDDALSVSLDSYKGFDLVRHKGPVAGAAIHDWECRRRVVNAVYDRRRHGDGRKNKKLPRKKLEGPFACIELANKTLALALDKALELLPKWNRDPKYHDDDAKDRGILLSKAEALEVLAIFQRDLLQRSHHLDDMEVNYLVYVVHLAAVLDLAFDDDASFLVRPRRNKDPSSSSKEATPACRWPLGFYLAQHPSLLR
mmetsp:Transcript_24313/g.78530  ORF Transcript_24313/g.78530 Transcript_24313/m.78530 type:complete len:404 (+) Transcript_24313:58-1269(+)